MIKSLRLNNFQSHKSSELELHPGVNVIVGETDSGKSAILRALYWLTFGKPAGDSMVRNNTKQCRVGVELDGGTLVSRVRGKTDNFYTVDEEVYKGFGQSIPGQVANALNMTEINFARQMDPPFLFSKSAGEVAEYLNKLINLDVIGKSLSNINRMTKGAEKEEDTHDRRVDELRTQLKSFSWVDNAEEDVAEIEIKERTVNKIKNSALQLTEELQDYARHQREFERCIDTRDAQKRLSNTDSVAEDLQKKLAHLTALRKVLFDYKQAVEYIAGLPNFSGADKAILAVEKQVGVLGAKRDGTVRLNGFVDQYQKYRNDVVKYTGEEKELVLQYTHEMPDICPLCGSEIKEV